jgi:hypothetical protein
MIDNAWTGSWFKPSNAAFIALGVTGSVKIPVGVRASRQHIASIDSLAQPLQLVGGRPDHLWSLICHKPKGA